MLPPSSRGHNRASKRAGTQSPLPSSLRREALRLWCCRRARVSGRARWVACCVVLGSVASCVLPTRAWRHRQPRFPWPCVSHAPPQCFPAPVHQLSGLRAAAGVQELLMPRSTTHGVSRTPACHRCSGTCLHIQRGRQADASTQRQDGTRRDTDHPLAVCTLRAVLTPCCCAAWSRVVRAATAPRTQARGALYGRPSAKRPGGGADLRWTVIFVARLDPAGSHGQRGNGL